MIVIRYPNGDLEVPARVATADAIGDGTERISEGHADYAAWIAAIERGRVEVQNAE